MQEYYVIKVGNFCNYMHFARVLCCTYEYSRVFLVFQMTLGEAYLASPLLWWCCTKGLVGHLQSCHDLCVCRGLIQQQMPLPLLLYHPPPVCEHIASGGVEGQGGRAFPFVCCEAQLAQPHVHTPHAAQSIKSPEFH